MRDEFSEKQYDGPYEVVGLEITNERELFKGVIYYPPEEHEPPHPVVIYFHGFPQLFTLPEIVKNFRFLLDEGYAFICFNFRGYRYCEGEISISSHVSDGLEVFRFVQKLSKEGVFDEKQVHLIAQDFGAYVALLTCSRSHLINKLALVCPIVDLRRHAEHEDFPKMLQYRNRFLPGSVRGIEDVDKFVGLTKQELGEAEHQVREAIQDLKVNELKVILGEDDMITPVSEVQELLIENSSLPAELSLIKGLDHLRAPDSEEEEIKSALREFLKREGD